MKGFRSIQELGGATDLSDLIVGTPSDGQVITWDNGNSQWEPADPSGGDVVLLYSSTITESTASIVTSSLPQTYAALKIYTRLQYDQSVSQGALYVRVNSIGASSTAYDTQNAGGRDTGAQVAEVNSADQWQFASALQGATATTAFGAGCELYLPRYAESLNVHTIYGNGGGRQGSLSYNAYVYYGAVIASAAITTLTFLPPSGNFISGFVRVYGIS